MLFFARYFNQALAILFNFLFIFTIYRIDLSEKDILFLLILLGYGPVFAFVDLVSSRVTFANIIKSDFHEKELNFFLSNLFFGCFIAFLVINILFFGDGGVKNISIIISNCFIFFGVAQSLRLVFNHYESKLKYEYIELLFRILFLSAILLIYFGKNSLSVYLSSISLILFLIISQMLLSKKFNFNLINLIIFPKKRCQILIFSLLEIFIHYIFFINLINLVDIENKDSILVWFRILLGLAAIMRIPLDLQVSILTKSFVSGKKIEMFRSSGFKISFLLLILSILGYSIFRDNIFYILTGSYIEGLPSNKITFILLTNYLFLHFFGLVVSNSGIYFKQVAMISSLISLLMLISLFKATLLSNFFLEIFLLLLVLLTIFNAVLFFKKQQIRS